MDLKEIIRKAHEYDSLMETLSKGPIQIFSDSEKDQKHSKGFMFDSLVYRFKDYQARAFQAEVTDYKYNHSCSDLEAREKVKGRHNRDLMRFIEILDEAIGEHD